MGMDVLQLQPFFSFFFSFFLFSSSFLYLIVGALDEKQRGMRSKALPVGIWAMV